MNGRGDLNKFIDYIIKIVILKNVPSQILIPYFYDHSIICLSIFCSFAC